MGWRKEKPVGYDEASRILREVHGLPQGIAATMLSAAWDLRPVTTPDGRTKLSYDGEDPGFVFSTLT
jgi:hypothetical protein